MRFELRVLGQDDVPLLQALNSLFAEAFEDPESYLERPPSEAWPRRLLGGPAFVALVALDEDVVDRGLTAHELLKFEQERSELFLYDLAVAGTHRRRGIATALIETLRRIAAERGAVAAFVLADTDEDDAAVIALYRRLGEESEVLQFDFEIPPPNADDQSARR